MTPKALQSEIALGGDIKRALEQWPQIEFADDHDGCLFTVTVTRKPVETLDLVDENAPKGEGAPRNDNLKGHLSGQPDPISDLLSVIRETPHADYATLADSLQVSEATVKRNIQKLKQQTASGASVRRKQATGRSSNENPENRRQKAPVHEILVFLCFLRESGYGIEYRS